MGAVLTLVGREDASALAAAELTRLGARVAEAVTLADGEAFDLPFDGLEPAAAEDAVRRVLAGKGVDFAVQDGAGRRKRLLVADMESTVIANEMLDELADFVGCRDAVERITARGMNGEIDFREALDERMGLLAGLPISALEQVLERVEIDPGAATLVATMRAHRATTALVSGGFGFFVERVRGRLGFDLQESNEFEVADGKLTGRVLEPVRDRAAKLRTLERLCGERDVTADAVVAVGDGANDLDMLTAAGLGVAFHAKPSVARAARFRVEHGDLKTLLYFQGYRRSEFRQG